MNFWKSLAHTELRKFTPAWLKALIREHFSLLTYDKERRFLADPYSHIESISSFVPEYPFTIGIFKEYTHYHQYYISACHEMKLSYKLLDITGTDWIEQVQDSRCDAFLVWPTGMLTIWKQLYDERLRIMVEDLGKIIYPSGKEIWIWESKRRMRDWLIAHNTPHPKTEIFYDIGQALEFLNNSKLPIVMKTDLGASSNGVLILRNRKMANKIVKRAFKKGLIVKGRDPRDRQWGSVIFQEYIPDVKEWRMVRIGNSFFGHPKSRVNDFHSGSGKVLWDTPSVELLNLLRDVTDKGNFTSMNIDIFETTDGRYLVNELQTVFGASYAGDQLRVNGQPGRYIYRERGNEWIFEAGDFARNACANLRVKFLLHSLLNQNTMSHKND